MTFIFDNALIVESKSWTLVHTDYEDRPFALYADGIEITKINDANAKLVNISMKFILASVYFMVLFTVLIFEIWVLR
ncbi:MAG: hypothetical protein IJ158_06195 [Treponema sp.]|nr:hypothetical protein [Treponema sp.]